AGGAGGEQHVIQTWARRRGRGPGDAARTERRLRRVVGRRISTGETGAAAAATTAEAAAAAVATVAGPTAAVRAAAAATTAAAGTAAGLRIMRFRIRTTHTAAGTAAGLRIMRFRIRTTHTAAVRRAPAGVAAVDLRLREHRSAGHGARPAEVDDAAGGDAGGARSGD